MKESTHNSQDTESNTNNENDTQYFVAEPINMNTINHRIEAEKQQNTTAQTIITKKESKWTPLYLILCKEILIIIALIVIVVNWNKGIDTGGNFSLVVGCGVVLLPFLLVLDLFTIIKGQKLWQETVFILSILFDIGLFALAPLIAALF